MREVLLYPEYSRSSRAPERYRGSSLTKYKPPPSGPLPGPSHSPAVGSQGGAFSDERGTPVDPVLTSKGYITAEVLCVHGLLDTQDTLR